MALKAEDVANLPAGAGRRLIEPSKYFAVVLIRIFVGAGSSSP